MMTALFLANAFLLGLAHALEPDHVAAVSTFISRYPGRRRAVRFCVRWGIGHMIPLLACLVGAGLVGTALPAGSASYAERGVGLMLIGLGAWLVRDVWSGRVHLHAHEHGGVRHVHLHAHVHTPAHDHGHARTVVAVGIMHGLAGSASVLVLAAVSMGSSVWLGAAYVLTFSCGVIVAMALYGVSTGAVLERFARARPGWLRLTQLAAGGFSVLLGAVWVLAV